MHFHLVGPIPPISALFHFTYFIYPLIYRLIIHLLWPSGWQVIVHVQLSISQFLFRLEEICYLPARVYRLTSFIFPLSIPALIFITLVFDNQRMASDTLNNEFPWKTVRLNPLSLRCVDDSLQYPIRLGSHWIPCFVTYEFACFSELVNSTRARPIFGK